MLSWVVAAAFFSFVVWSEHSRQFKWKWRWLWSWCRLETRSRWDTWNRSALPCKVQEAAVARGWWHACNADILPCCSRYLCEEEQNTSTEGQLSHSGLSKKSTTIEQKCTVSWLWTECLIIVENIKNVTLWNPWKRENYTFIFPALAHCRSSGRWIRYT